MLEPLLSAIERLDLTPDEVAEAVWLARYIPAGPTTRPVAPARSDLPSPPAGLALPEPPARAERPESNITATTAPAERRASVLVPRGNSAGQADAISLRAPGVTALRHAPALLRALRPLRRIVRLSGPAAVNESATAVEIAQTGLWLPHLSPTPVRFFDIAIVVDASAAVGVWHSTVDELRLLLERLGAFRDVRLWTLAAAAGSNRLIVRAGTGATMGLPRDPTTLVDPTGRRIILLVSDCVGEPWRSGVIATPLGQWGQVGPVAVVHPLPYRLWTRCAAHFTPVRLARTGASYANRDLLVRARTGLALTTDLGCPVPVLELEPRWLASYAQLLAGPPHDPVDAVVVATARISRSVLTPHDPSPVASSAEVVRQFQASASAEASRLARYLATVPLTLPVMRLVQAVTMPDTHPSHLAEVFLGGLWRRTAELDDPEEAEYEFRPGVRQVLLAGLRRSDTLRVINAVSDFIRARLGARHDFKALLTADPRTVTSAGLSPAFATVSATVLRSLGGRYAELADRLQAPGASDPVISDLAPVPATPKGGTVSPAASHHRGPADSGADHPPAVFKGIPPRNVHFTGRDRLLHELRERLVGGVAALVPCALYGLGGVGKTQVAVEYCYRYSHEYDLICWLSAEHGPRLRASLTALAPHLNVAQHEDQSQTVNAVLDALRRGEPYSRWLLVLDNAPGPDEIQEFFRSSTGHLLATSRNRSWAGTDNAAALEIDVFSRDESIQLLRHRLGYVTPVDASLLASRVGDLPMALEQAAAYQLVYGVSIEEYLRLLDRNPAGVLGAGRAPGYDHSVRDTFRVAFDGLRRQSLAAAQLMELTAFFAAEPISRGILYAGSEVSLPSPLSSVINDELQLIQVIGEIARLSLARLDSRHATVQVHRLLRELIRGSLSEAQRRANTQAVQEILAKANPGLPDERAMWSRHAELAPHVTAAACVDADSKPIRKTVLDQVRYLYATGDYLGSWEVGEQALKNWRDRLGFDAEETLILARHLGNTLRAMGRTSEARQLNEDTWQRLVRCFGEENVHSLVAANSFGADLRISGEYRRAHELDRENLDRHRRVFGPEDVNTLRSANNYAANLRLLGRFQDALDQDRATLRLTRAALGQDHTLTYLVEGNVARDLYGVGDYAGALTLLEQMLPSYEQVLSAEHSNVLRVTRTYAATLRRLGRTEDARNHVSRILRIYRVRFGEKHIDTIDAIALLSKILLALGEPHAALGRGEAALASYQGVLGPTHPFTLATAVNLAVVLRVTGDHGRAAELGQEALSGLRETLGDDHPSTLCALANVASDRHLAGDFDSAAQISAEVAARFRAVRGENHPGTFQSTLNYALDLRAIGETARADELTAQAVAGLTRSLGPGHHVVQLALAGQRVEFDIEPPPT